MQQNKREDSDDRSNEMALRTKHIFDDAVLTPPIRTFRSRVPTLKRRAKQQGRPAKGRVGTPIRVRENPPATIIPQADDN